MRQPQPLRRLFRIAVAAIILGLLVPPMAGSVGFGLHRLAGCEDGIEDPVHSCDVLGRDPALIVDSLLTFAYWGMTASQYVVHVFAAWVLVELLVIVLVNLGSGGNGNGQRS